MNNNLDYSKLDLREIQNNLVDNMVMEITTKRDRAAQLEPLYLELLRRGRIDIYKQACRQTAAIILSAHDKTKSMLLQNIKNLRELDLIDSNRTYHIEPELSLLTECNNYRMATITGDSMIEAGINDGDDIIIELTQDVGNNDIVVLKFYEKIMVKRYINVNGEIWLKPENKNYEAVKIDKSMNLEIIGKVKSVIHRF